MEKYEGSKWSEIEVEEEIYRIIEEIAKIKRSAPEQIIVEAIKTALNTLKREK